jgi:hypothetical protein
MNWVQLAANQGKAFYEFGGILLGGMLLILPHAGWPVSGFTVELTALLSLT